MRATVRCRFVPLALGLLLAAGLAPRLRAGPLYDYRETTLENGLRVITFADQSCPIVNVQLWYHVGSKDEDPGRQGFAHMFEHMMFRGTDQLGPTDHFDLVHRNGGECNAYTSFDQTVYHETLPANQLELALWLEAERMAFLKIDQASFDTERKVVEEERRLGLNRPYGSLAEKALAELFHVHPYRWSTIGQIPHLRAASVPELRAFWTRYYVPNNATLVISGAVSHERAQQLARQYFGWIPRAEDPPRITAQEPQQEKARSVTLKEENAPAPLCGIIFHTVPLDHPDAVPLQLLGSILGGGQSSRLYRELVAEKQVAMMAAAAQIELEQAGLFAAGAVLSPMGGDIKKVLPLVEAHLARVRTEPVSEHELTKARNEALRNLIVQTLTVEGRAGALGRAAVLEHDVAAVNRRMDQIRAATAADLLRVAQLYLAPEHGLEAKVERNLLGALAKMLKGKKAQGEDDAPITAQPETSAPPPGRPGVARPANYPTTAPAASRLDYDATLHFESATLPNGLKLRVIENHKTPYVSVQLGLRAGACTEAQPGTASLATGMLTKGTTQHDEGALADELETYAISLGGEADMDTSSVSAGCLTEHLDRATRLLAEVVQQSTFPASEFEKLRKQVRTGLAIACAEPSYIADRELRRRIFCTHPYARTATGEIADVDVLKADDVREWWQRFARPDGATLIFAGDVNLATAKQLAEKYLGEWRVAGAAPQVELPTIPPPNATRIYLVDQPGIQAQIRLGRLGITRKDPGYFISRVVSGYFGGAFSARLNDLIRVKMGLTYGAFGGFTTQRLAGEFRASTFTKVESTAAAVRALLAEIERLQSAPPTAEELDKTKSYTLVRLPTERETPQQIAEALWLLESNDLPADHYAKLLAGVAAASADDCVRLVKQTVDPAKLVIVVVGPAKDLKTALEEIAPVTVVEAEKPEAKPAEPGDDSEDKDD